MKTKHKLLLYIASFFLFLLAGIFFLNYTLYKERIHFILENRILKLETNYRIFLYNTSQLSDNIYEDTIANEQIITLLAKANQTTKQEELSILRKELEELVIEKYLQIQKRGVLQYHFVLPNNYSFLRMQKISKFGDDLSKIRKDFAYVNQNKTTVRGFSQGRTAHGFRNIYPIFGKNKEYLGAIEISFSSELLQGYLENVSGIHSHFLVDKRIFESTAWDRDDMVMQYQPSLVHPNMMINLTYNHNNSNCIVTTSNDSENLIEKISYGIDQNKKFAVFSGKSDCSNLIALYPIQEALSDKVAGWLVSYEDVPLVKTIKRDRDFINIFSLVVVLIIFYFVYKNILQQQLIKKSQKELLEKTEEQKTLLALFDEGNSVLFKWKSDEKWTVEYVSLSVKTLLGYEAKEFIEKKMAYSDCIHKQDLTKLKEEVEEVIGSNKQFFSHQPYRVITKENQERWVLEYTNIVRNKQGEVQYYLGYIVDITETKNKERLLQEQSKLASMGEMIGNIAHQWRQPLSVISTGATGLIMEYECGVLDQEKIPKICTMINENAQYLSHTIDDFRNFIKGERVLKEFFVEKSVESFLHLVEPSIKSHNITVILDIQKDLLIKGYENELQQCFINIFNNSKDALKEQIKEGERLFFITIKKEKTDTMLIEFYDNANGIPDEILPKVFEPYFTTKHQSQGTGLGLHMTYNMITSGMDGTIEIENTHYSYKGNKYKGAKIEIRLTI